LNDTRYTNYIPSRGH